MSNSLFCALQKEWYVVIALNGFQEIVDLRSLESLSQDIICDAQSSEAIIGLETPFLGELIIVKTAGLDFYTVIVAFRMLTSKSSRNANMYLKRLWSFQLIGTFTRPIPIFCFYHLHLHFLIPLLHYDQAMFLKHCHRLN